MSNRNEGIREQAKRVVLAYHELRADAASADFKSDQFPVGLFGELIQQIRLLEQWLLKVPAEPAPQSFAEHAENQLSNVKSILCEIDHLAHDGQESNDPTMTLSVIKRLAGEGSSVLFGEFWDQLTAALKGGDDAVPNADAANDAQADDSESAAQMLKQLEQQSEAMEFHAVADYLTGSQYLVANHVCATDTEDEYTVSHSWTEKGVRHQWAEQKLIAKLRGFDE
jgi:hypothetical protein